MQRGSIFNYILILLFILMLFGYISLGDVLSFVGYIIMGIILLIVVGVLIFRIRLNNLRRRMEDENGQQQGSYRTYTWNFGGKNDTAHNTKKEGDVTISRKSAEQSGRVNKDVGDYVDYEDVEHKQQ